MAAPNVLTEEQILAEVQRTLQQQTQNDGKPRIKVGNQEFDPQNAQAIQDAINNALNANKSEFDTLRQQVQQLTNSRTVDPTVEPPPIPTQVQPIPPKPAPVDLSDEEWAAQFVKMPRRTLDETIGRMLGVEGSGMKAIIAGFNHLNTELQATKLQNQALLQKAQELDVKISSTEARTEAQQFIDTHEDYEINPQNQAIMEQYLTEYGLAPTARNLGLVFNQAKSDGKLQPKQTQQTQQTQQFTQQPPLRQGMPRLGGQSDTNMDGNYLLEQANRLSLDDHAALIERLRSGQFQR
jgi:hypothetical protein